MRARKIGLEEEESLVRRAVRGDGEAFGTLYDAYRDFIFSAVIYPRVGSADAAEEILSETFLLALQKLPSFEWRGKSIAHWLQSIALNKVMEWSAQKRKDPVFDDAFLSFTPDSSFQPEERAILDDHRAILKKRIEETLGALNERYRRVIELRLVRRLSRSECARTMDVSVGTLDVLFFRACRAFRKAYREKHGISDPRGGAQT
ncbi:MAG: RNA polymerase sigma factor [bacterium]